MNKITSYNFNPSALHLGAKHAATDNLATQCRRRGPLLIFKIKNHETDPQKFIYPQVPKEGLLK